MLKLYIDGNPLVADHFSGVGHYTLGIVRALNDLAKNNKVDIYVVVPADRKEKINKYGFRHIQVKTLPMNHVELHEQIVGDCLPDMDALLGRGVYFFPDFVTWPLAASKCITTVHDLSFEQVPQFVDDGNARFLQRAVRSTAQRADRIATVTDTMKHVIADFYDLKKRQIIVTNNAANPDVFYERSASEIRRVKKKYEIEGEYILCVGNIEPRKNQIGLLRAYHKLPKALKQRYSVILVGAGGWKNEKLHELIRSLPAEKIKIIEGKVKDEEIPALYSGAALSVNPSFYEGFGMPTIEAMACKSLTLASDIPVIREIAGESNIYVNPGSISSIAKGLEQALTLTGENKKRIIEANYDNAMSYNWQTAAEKIIDTANVLNIERKLGNVTSWLKKPLRILATGIKRFKHFLGGI